MTGHSRLVMAVGGAAVLTAMAACSGQQRALPTMQVPDPVVESGESVSAGLVVGARSDDDAGTGTDAGSAVQALAESVDVTELDELRTGSAEDRERVLALLEAAGYDLLGEYVVTVEAEQGETAVVLDFDEPASGSVASTWLDAVEQRGTLVLAAAGDLDEIHVHRADRPVAVSVLDRARADALVGEPVLDLGATRSGLEELVRILESLTR